MYIKGGANPDDVKEVARRELPSPSPTSRQDLCSNKLSELVPQLCRRLLEDFKIEPVEMSLIEVYM